VFFCLFYPKKLRVGKEGGSWKLKKIMAIKQYTDKFALNGTIYWYRPRTVVFPEGTHKYVQTKWIDDYTWFRLSYLIYGTTKLYWWLMQLNDVADPYDIKNGEPISFLLPEYLNEVV